MVNELPHIVIAVLFDQQPIPVQQGTKLPIVAAVWVVLTHTELSLTIVEFDGSLVESSLMGDAFVCVYDGLVALCGQPWFNLRQFQLFFGICLLLWVGKTVITAYIDFLLITEILNATHPLFLSVFYIFEV